MKAIVHRRYGTPEVLRLEEVDPPVPGEGEVVIRVRAAAVNPLDWYFIRGTPRLVRLGTGLWKPRAGRPGVDLAGEVETVGANVRHLAPGDAVFGTARGAFAELAVAKDGKVVRKPDQVGNEEAAAIPIAGVTALQGLRDRARVRAGDRVLVNGAAGGVGTFAVQIAKSFGAEVTGVCSTRNVELVRGLGADRVLDYTRDDFTTSATGYDVVFDCVTNRSARAIRRVLRPGGRWIIAGGLGRDAWLRPMGRIMAGKIVASLARRDLTVETFIARSNAEDLRTLGGLVAAGTVRPVIDSRFPLARTAEAVALVAGGHARGKVVVVM